MITYNEIYEGLRKEKYSEQLQPLSKDFVKQVAEYFKEKKEMTKKEEDLFSESIIKTKRQLENAVLIFKELMLKRKKKILHLAFIAAETGITKRDFDNMLDFEKEMFEKIMQTMENTDKNVADLLNSNTEEKEAKMFLLNFKNDVEEFLGLEGEKLGPFSKGEIVSLPEQIARILVDDGKAELISDE
jgi:DNA replication initiation complex subunit (GINS family)